MPEGVLLDLDGVLVRYRKSVWPEFAEWLLDCTEKQLSTEEMLRRIMPVWEKYYRQIIWLQVTPENELAFWLGLANEVLQALESKCGAERLLTEWPYFRFLEPVPGARALLEWLKIRGYLVGVYANTVPSLRENLNYHGFGSFVDHAFSSSEIGYVKPDGRGYQLVAKRMGLLPSQIIYFDEDEYNVLYARKTGYKAFLVRLGIPGPEVIHDLDLIYEVLD